MCIRDRYSDDVTYRSIITTNVLKIINEMYTVKEGKSVLSFSNDSKFYNEGESGLPTFIPKKLVRNPMYGSIHGGEKNVCWKNGSYNNLYDPYITCTDRGGDRYQDLNGPIEYHEGHDSLWYGKPRIWQKTWLADSVVLKPLLEEILNTSISNERWKGIEEGGWLAGDPTEDIYSFRVNAHNIDESTIKSILRAGFHFLFTITNKIGAFKITTSKEHGLTVGDKISINGMPSGNIDGKHFVIGVEGGNAFFIKAVDHSDAVPSGSNSTLTTPTIPSLPLSVFATPKLSLIHI